MHLPFREYHLLQLFDQWSEQKLPLDVAMNHYFRAHKAIGSKDKKFIAETAYEMVRKLRLLEALGGATWAEAYQILQDLESHENQIQSLDPAVRLSCPDALFNLLVEAYGQEQAQTLCEVHNTRAPTTVRANPVKTSREALLQRWQGTYQVKPCQEAPFGIRFLQKINFFGLDEFKAGLFEVQDEGSQLLADLLEAQPGDAVMDYCAGSGGKTLAFAHRLEGKGQIYLHDVRERALLEAKQRLKRAGLQNTQILHSEHIQLKRLKGKMDWVFADVPCSGTGTLRRNPDMKWRFKSETLQELVPLQRVIFERALSFVKPGGHLIYGTCSLLPQENQDQTAHFLNTYPVSMTKEFQVLPSLGGMDGFYGAVFQKKAG